MSKYACKNCKWQGDTPMGPLNHCPVCGDNTEQIANFDEPVPVNPKPVDILDLNRDGKVDEKDASIAAKSLANARHKGKGGRR